MNYYERHIGDYARDAGHLTMLEHGAYTMLLDRYYSTEKPIPADQAHRVCRAKTKEEKAAVDTVLAEFFDLVDGAWMNGRATREIAKAQTKIEAARANGAKGGRPKANPKPSGEKPTGLADGSDWQTQEEAHQTPDTRHQAPEEHTHPTAAGRVCGLMRQVGIADTNPGHPLLLALLDAGCTDGEIAGAAKSAVDRRKGFAYVLGTLKRQREEAAAAVLHVGEMPQVMTPGQAASHARVMAVSPRLAARKPEPMKEIFDVTARLVG